MTDTSDATPRPDDMPSEEHAENAISFLEACADQWAIEVDLLSMIENVVSPMRLNRNVPDEIRDSFTHRMKAQIDAICRQCFLEGAVRGIDGIKESRAEAIAEAERARTPETAARASVDPAAIRRSALEEAAHRPLAHPPPEPGEAER